MQAVGVSPSGPATKRLSVGGAGAAGGSPGGAGGGGFSAGGFGSASRTAAAVLAAEAYARPLSFYEVPPTEEITVEQFEHFALQRLRVLQVLDAARVKGLPAKEKNARMQEELRRAGLLNLTGNAEDRRRDVVSHFALRFAFCRVADRRWFVAQELALFRFRLRRDVGMVTVPEFLKANGREEEYPPCTAAELAAIQPQIDAMEALAAHNAGSTVEAMAKYSTGTYYKVRFEEALDMVRHRKVFLRGGYAYVPEKQFSDILVSRLRLHLTKSLATAYRAIQSRLSGTTAFDAIAPTLQHLSASYTDAEATYSADNSARRAGAVRPADIDKLAPRSFALCMRHLHSQLRKDHHLKHQARMQYGLFLKGIGLDLKDALSFWRAEFQRTMPADKFDKSYAYNIRHNYGKEGKRTDYTPYSCIKIILMPAGTSAGEAHGCPFKHHGRDHLRDTLRRDIQDPAGIQQILELVENNHFQIACRKHWELTHPDAPHDQQRDLVINHPNQYFDESDKYFTDRAAAAGDPAAAAAQARQAGFGPKPSTLNLAQAPSTSSSSSSASAAAAAAAAAAQSAANQPRQIE